MAQQRVKVNRRPISHAAQCFVIIVKARLGKAHVPGQFAKDLGVGFGLAQRRDGRAVEQHIGMPIAQMHIPMLQLGGGRQEVVGIVGGVSLKMFQHHSEQVFARKPGHHFA